MPPNPSLAGAPDPVAIRPIPGLPSYWHHFLLSVLFLLVIPLFPLGFELWKTHDVSDSSCTLVAAMYAIAIAATSSSLLLFGVGFVISIVFSMVYGNLLALTTHMVPSQNGVQIVTNTALAASGLDHCGGAALICIGIVFAYHAVERFNLHVAQRKPFFVFTAIQ